MASDLQAAFRESAKKLEVSIESCGLKSTGNFVAVLEGIREQTGQGQGDILEQAGRVVKDFNAALEAVVANPASLAPASGCFAACGSWYGSQVCAKLGAVKEESSELLSICQELGSKVSTLVKELNAALSKAVPAIDGEVKELIAVPGVFLNIADMLQEAPDILEAIGKIDMTVIEQGLDVSPLNPPLDVLAGVKAKLGPLINEVQSAVSRVSCFTEKAPNQIRTSFDIMPCIPSSAIAPPTLGSLLGTLDTLKGLDLKALVSMLANTNDASEQLDIEAVRGRISTFADSAAAQTKSLRETLDSVKIAAQTAKAGNEALTALQGGDVEGALKQVGDLSAGLKNLF